MSYSAPVKVTQDGPRVPTGGTRPLRRDAEVNLARILSAARDVFAEQGYDAPMEAIAARADVGVGTLYRRFPNKADLFTAVVDAANAANREIAEEVLATVAPKDALFEFVRRCVAAPSCWRATISAPPFSCGIRSALEHISPLLEAILHRTQQAGTVRDDIEVADVAIALMSVRSIADLCDTDDSSVSQRFLELTLDGMRPGHAAPAHPAISIEQLGEMLRRR